MASRFTPGGGIKMEFSVREDRALKENLRQFDQTVRDDIQEMNAEWATITKELVQQFCPQDTGWMHDHVRKDVTAYTFEVGWKYDDFVSRKNGYFYPVAQEFGNARVQAQPSLGPAYRITGPQYARELKERIRAAAAAV